MRGDLLRSDTFHVTGTVRPAMTELIDSRPAFSPKRKTQADESIPAVPTAQQNPFLPRQTSPTPSDSSSLTELSNVLPPQSHATSNPPPSKKRKLNPAEKAAAKKEKEEKARLRLEEKVRKDEEKRRLAEEKDAVKREKEVEKAEKLKDKQEQDAEKLRKKARKEEERRAKESERQMKDAEKAQKEAERLKKERVSVATWIECRCADM